MLTVKKANGETQEFSQEKLIHSIGRAGIPKDIQDQVLAHVKEKLYDGMPTSELYHHITEFLKKSPYPYAPSKYSLKKAIMDLGPTGHPFEDYVAKLLSAEGYQTKVRQTLQGKCITHEIDVVAMKDGKTTIVEAKFHNENGVSTDVHVALYTEARFQDVSAKNHFDSVMVVTNTNLTTDATSYAQCMGMEVLAWNHPEGKGLRDLVEEYHLHPITTLSTLSQQEKNELLEQGIILCTDLQSNKQLLNSLGLSQEKQTRILEEVTFVGSS